MYGCDSCGKSTAITLLVLGVLFLLRDIGVWDFFNIQWWTALFLLMGGVALAGCHCKDCQTVVKKKR